MDIKGLSVEGENNFTSLSSMLELPFSHQLLTRPSVKNSELTPIAKQILQHRSVEVVCLHDFQKQPMELNLPSEPLGDIEHYSTLACSFDASSQQEGFQELFLMYLSTPLAISGDESWRNK